MANESVKRQNAKHTSVFPSFLEIFMMVRESLMGEKKY
jgi:hypothetical protein